MKQFVKYMTALTLACSLTVLVGCGSGSGPTPPEDLEGPGGPETQSYAPEKQHGTQHPTYL